MTRHRRGGRWRTERARDGFVRRAREAGYRSRAVFKLMELDRRYRLLRPGMRIVDLGAAPGGWSQYARRRIGARGRLVAVDRRPMAPLPGVVFVQGDFTDPAVAQRVRAALDGAADLVMSDSAPDISGIGPADAARTAALAQAAFAAAVDLLRPGGALLLKVFEGPELAPFRDRLASTFGRLLASKPRASRARSRELYLLGLNLRGADRGRT